MMELDRTLAGLRRLRDKTTCFACSGCGMEHNCSDDGCRIIRSSIEQLEKLSRELATSEAARTELWKQLVSARQELAEVKAERSWISVKDRLPELTMPPHDVLVYHDLNCGMFIDRAWYSHEKDKWRSAVGMNLNVTHWMPLPAPPEKEA